MKVNIIKMMVGLILLVLFSACGSDDSDGNKKKGNTTYNDGAKNKNGNDTNTDNNNQSSTIFALTTASAFETKFVNKEIHPPSGRVITILPNGRLRQIVANNTPGEATYAYRVNSKSLNTIALTYKIGDTDCLVNLTWTSELGGNSTESYNTSSGAKENTNGTFYINGKN